MIAQLEQHHAGNEELLKNMEQALARLEAGKDGALDEFSDALASFTEAQWSHMSLEEKTLIPAAKQHLLPEDWSEIADAFGKNGDPRFGAEPDTAFRKMFSRIARLGVPSAELEEVES